MQQRPSTTGRPFGSKDKTKRQRRTLEQIMAEKAKV
jgi:hypothetical protein